MTSSIKRLVPRQLINYKHLAEAVAYNAARGFPSRGLKVIGVTGTNGKTTTCYLIHRMLVEAGYNVGLMTTVAYGVNDDITPQAYHMTTVPPPELTRRIKAMRQQGIEYLVLETTSQALAQHRVWGVPYVMAVFTNLTHEHLDWHSTFENYRNAKRMLFKMTDANAQGLRLGIVNADDPNGRYFASDVTNPVLYGRDKGDVRATKVKLSSRGIAYDAVAKDATYHITSHLAGSFNVYNTLATVCVGRSLGLRPEQIEQGIAALKGVAGRMTRLDEGQDFSVIVDYAHSPDSFEQLFKDLRPVVKGKLIVMFGSAGRRDEAKRAIQGELAGRYADEVVLTEEDDRDIDGQTILNEIAAGAEQAGKVRGKNLHLVHDRTKAIAATLKLAASKDDTVLLLGKGHEKTIERADGEHPWDEIGTAGKALRKLVK